MAFEHLCADFMREEYGLNNTPRPHDTGKYPWTEGFPVQGNEWKMGYQAKWWVKAFSKGENSIIDSCEKIVDWTEILCIFTKKDRPSPKTDKQLRWAKVDRNSYSAEDPQQTEDWWSWYGNEYLTKKKWFKGVIFWCGWEFLDRIKNFEVLLHKYFWTNEVKKELYSRLYDSSKIDSDEIKLRVNMTTNGFEGDPEAYENDLKQAMIHQKKYDTRKLGYALWAELVLEDFKALENTVATETFELLENKSWFEDLDDYVNTWSSYIQNHVKKRFEIELNELIGGMHWLFVNYWTIWLSWLLYEKWKKAKFINKSKWI